MKIGKLNEIVRETFHALGYLGVNGDISKQTRKGYSHFQCNDCFKISKSYDKPPFIIANEVVEKIKSLDNFHTFFKDIDVAMPGFINISLSDEYLHSLLMKLSRNGIVTKDMRSSGTCVVDYGGANIAKPMHVGHLRSAVIGESVKRLYEIFGYKVVGDVHLGDFGLQIGQVIYGLIKHGLAEDVYNSELQDKQYPKVALFTINDLKEIYPEISRLCKKDQSIKDEVAEITKQLQDGHYGYRALFDHIRSVSIADLRKGYGTLNVKFDYWYGESDSWKYIDSIEKLLYDKNLLVEDDRALIVNVKDSSDKIDIPPLIFRKSNGALLYGSTDLATIYQRKYDFSPTDIVYIVDKRQELHFTQVERVARKLGLLNKCSLNHFGFGTMNGKDGKPFKTRDGGALNLNELFRLVQEKLSEKRGVKSALSREDSDKILNAVVRYADLQTQRERDYIFDIDKFSEFSGKTGPYILYTIVRLRKLLDKLLPKDRPTLSISVEPYGDLDEQLRLRLLEVYDVMEYTFKEKSFHILCEYVFELCTILNTIYQSDHLLSEPDSVKVNSMSGIFELTVKTLVQLLDVLAIEVPTEM